MPSQSAADPLQRRLREAVDALLRSEACPADQRAAVGDLYALFSELTQVGDAFTSPEHQIETVLPQGTAISSKDAARCLLDEGRTAQFLRGIEAAIREAQRRFPAQTIEILYAGCGPYATLALPLCTRFSPTEVQFTLIDIHGSSLRAAGTLLDRLGLSAYVHGFVQGDAATYRHPADQPLHLVVSENMQRALSKEPQLAITSNLAPQLTRGGLFIPQQVSIDLGLADLSKESVFLSSRVDGASGPPPARDRIRLGRPLEVTPQSAPALVQSAKQHVSGVIALPAERFVVPELAASSVYHAMLWTTATVFGRYDLRDYDSGLTQPRVLHELGILRGGETIELCYHLGQRPGFVAELVVPAGSPTAPPNRHF
jgi:hypothetical protein